ncbi:MAG: radical SAM family heme chaperone HemW [Desulfobacterales bacterium]|nr:radical SAM family heme chaperone HemW [Desulfobacterales bacterium]
MNSKKNSAPSRKGFVANYPNFRHWKTTDSREMTQKPINIYLHIPFCIQRCAYCYYSTIKLKGSGRSERLEKYVNTLCREIELASQYFNLKERPVVSIYIGGGTPTVMNEELFRKVTEHLHRYLNIDNSEFTVEAEPVTLTQKKADLLESLGINRISLGVQSFHDDILELCDRLDKEDKALKAISLARGTGAAVNIDLLSGLAGETPDTWAYTLERALSTEAESITVYKMELYANTEYYKRIRKKEIHLPRDDQELEFMQYAMDKFDQAQYLPWSFFTFTKNGDYEHKYATSIWRGTDCYAFGVSSFGEMGTWLFQNTNDQEKYMELVNAGEIPINRGYHLTSLDQMVRTVMLEMKLVRLDLNAFQNRYGFKLESLCADTMDQLVSEGYIFLNNGGIEKTRKGLLYGDYAGKQLAGALKEMF